MNWTVKVPFDLIFKPSGFCFVVFFILPRKLLFGNSTFPWRNRSLGAKFENFILFDSLSLSVPFPVLNFSNFRQGWNRLPWFFFCRLFLLLFWKPFLFFSFYDTIFKRRQNSLDKNHPKIFKFWTIFHSKILCYFWHFEFQ